MSEPDAGSDIGAMRTSARRDGDSYIISGQKIWATGAGAKNNFINVYVKTDPKAHYRQGMSLFLVDNTSPGLEVRKLDMLGRRSVGTYELTFNDVRVPAENLIGGENNGWKCVLAGLQAERAVAAATDCGSARGVFEMALHYATERKQFNRTHRHVPVDRTHASRHADGDRRGVVADVARRRHGLRREGRAA